MAFVGYARVSTVGQDAGFEDQLEKLSAFGCDQIFSEKFTGTTDNRPELTRLRDYVRSGDTVVATRMDRLARNTQALLKLVQEFEAKDVRLVLLDLGGTPLDTTSATGKLILTVLSAVGEAERAIMRERQMIGIERARKEGRLKGRPAKLTAHKDQIKAMIDQGIPKAQIARELGMGRTRLYQLIGEVA